MMAHQPDGDASSTLPLGPADGFYLGIDCGTQSLKALVVDEDLRVVAEASVSFDGDLPHYGTAGGCHRSGTRVTAPPLMWTEALECAVAILRDKGDLSLVKAVAFSAQQHATVYWAEGAGATLATLRPDVPLVTQLTPAFAVPESPIWMDASTAVQCRRLEDCLGGPAAVARLTGSRAYERFSGNQIAYIRDHHPDQYDRCERISLASSFLATLFLGEYAPIDVGDGSGMNLLDLRTRQWDPQALEVAGGPSLSHKLGSEVVPSPTVLGHVANYWVSRFGFDPQCAVVAGTGDNNSALVGLRVRPTDVVVSLGTSDTVTASVRSGEGRTEGHLLGHPVLGTGFMAMLCYANGSLARERVRDDAVGHDWGAFTAALAATPPGNAGYMAIYFFNQEITPQYRRPGVYRFGPSDEPLDTFPDGVTNHDVRAVIEGQCLAKRLHASRLSLSLGPDSRLLACGGAAGNVAILQVLADVFGVPVYRDPALGVHAAAYGAAVRAAHALHLRATPGSDSEAVYLDLMGRTPPFKLVCNPNPAHRPIYDQMLRRYEALETSLPRLGTTD